MSKAYAVTTKLEDNHPLWPGLAADFIDLTSLGGGEPRGAEYSGIKALMLAVLEEGIESYLSPVQRVRADAECWVMSRQERLPFSFSAVCETLGLDPDAVRRAIRRLPQKTGRPRRALPRSRPNARASDSATSWPGGRRPTPEPAR